MAEDSNNPARTTSSIANTSELSQTSQIPDVEAGISQSVPDILSDDIIQKEAESTETTEDSSSTSKRQEDRNPLATKLMNLLECQHYYLSELDEEYHKKESDLTEKFDQVSRQNQELENKNEELETKVKNPEYDPKNTYSNNFANRQNQPNHRTRQQLELEDKVNHLEQQLQESQQKCCRLQKKYSLLQDEVSRLEIGREKLLAQVASSNRNTDTHYDGTSSRPQHHTLINEYDKVRELIETLANSLYKFIKQSNSEIKDPHRKEKINKIKAIISESILIYGHKIMQEGLTKVIDSVTGQPKLDADKKLSSQVEESRIKLLNIEKELQYSPAGEWQERDFQQATTELSDRFYSQLELDPKGQAPEIRTEMEVAIKKILDFLNCAARAEPPANFQMIEKGASFDPIRHEAAKNSEEAGKIVATIFPAYLVNNELKVRAIVLTEP